MNEKLEKVITTVESLSNIKKEKEKFSWIDKILRWINRAFLTIWIFKKRGM